MKSLPPTRTFAANSYSYIHTLLGKTFMERLGKQGFSQFELMIYPGHFWPDELAGPERRDLSSWLRRNELRIVSLNPPSLDINLASMTPEMRKLSQSIYAQTIELAADIECNAVVVVPGKASPLFPAPHSKMLDALFEGFDHLVPLCERLGVRLALENVPISILPKISDVLSTLDDYGNSHIGVTYDVANGAFVGEDPAAALRDISDRLALIHLSDTNRNIWSHSEVGDGVVPFQEIAKALEDLAFQGPRVLEIATKRGEPAVLDSAKKLAAMGF